MAKALSVPVSYFFEPNKISTNPKEEILGLPGEDLSLLKYFWKIKNKQKKKIVVQVAQLASRV